ncbi:integrase [Plantactinospora sp. B6F1]|uniref:integrase n=1 Tax=Plantactinospora sp. B6F1 TaxID=3158971 RepID=UPI0032D8BCD8
MKSRLRRLYAQDREFAWTARIHYVRTGQGARRCVRVRVWGAGKNSRALQADLLSTPDSAGQGDREVIDDGYPGPRHVRAVIDHALRHGWQPEEIGGTFVLTGAGHAEALLLPGFVVTDLLLLAERATPGG